MHPNGVVGVTIGVTMGVGKDDAPWRLRFESGMRAPAEEFNDGPMAWGERRADVGAYRPTDFST